MSLSNLQHTLARIYTDSQLRDDFLTNPDVVGRTLKLNCIEIQQLSQLSSKEVNLFASSLKYKRLGEIRKLLPLTTKALNNKLNKFFFAYCESFLPEGNQKHLQDAIAFTKYLSIQDAKDFDFDWIRDIVRYERMWLKVINTNKLFTCDRFNYPISALIHSLQTADVPHQFSTRANFTIWFRFALQSQWHTYSIYLPTKY